MASGTSQEGSCQQGDCGRVTVTSPQLSPPHGNRPRLHPGESRASGRTAAPPGPTLLHLRPSTMTHWTSVGPGASLIPALPTAHHHVTHGIQETPAASGRPCSTQVRACVCACACVSARTCLPQACGVVGGGEPGSPDTPTCTSNLHLPSCTAAGSPPHPHDGVCNATPGATWLPAGHPPGTSASACAGQPGAP